MMSSRTSQWTSSMTPSRGPFPSHLLTLTPATTRLLSAVVTSCTWRRWTRTSSRYRLVESSAREYVESDNLISEYLTLVPELVRCDPSPPVSPRNDLTRLPTRYLGYVRLYIASPSPGRSAELTVSVTLPTHTPWPKSPAPTSPPSNRAGSPRTSSCKSTTMTPLSKHT